MRLVFEDFPVGYFGSFGPCHVTHDDIVSFASEFDPQPMHVDEAAAAEGMLKGLSGSGWHLCSVTARMIADHVINRAEIVDAPGVDQVRWLSPLRPGDDLSMNVEVLDARLSDDAPDTGVITLMCTTSNAAGQPLCQVTAPLVLKRRAEGAA